MPQITNPGALWDECSKFYPRLDGTPHLRLREWRWPRGGKIKFSHLQFETTVYEWQGAQITLICFDELTHFSAHQFFYMVSRNRSTCGVRPYIPSGPACRAISSASAKRSSGPIAPKN
jgi:Terminase large subunit, T4likevirus-type, N-terminal